MTVPIRAELFYGTAYGVGLSAAIWTLALAPPGHGSDPLLFLALSAALGTLLWRMRPLGRLATAYPLTLAGLILYGPGVAMAAGLMGILTADLARAAVRPPRGRHAVFDLSCVALATSSASVAFWQAGGVAGTGDPAQLTPRLLVAHLAAYAAVQIVLSRMALLVGPSSGPAWPGWGVLTRAMIRYGVGVFAGLGLARGFASMDVRPWLLAAAVFGLPAFVYAARRRLTRQRALHRSKSSAIYRAVTDALTKTIEVKDEDTQRHLRRVQKLCLDLGRELDLSPRELQALSSAALLHDIGKIAVPEGILTKPGKLTDREMEHVRAHATIGADILEAIPFPYPVAPIVRHHHERWDGEGYPDGLAGESTPVGSRILSVVDTYDALTSDRPYRRALPPPEVATFLRRESGRMFDPCVVEALLSHLGESVDDDVEAMIEVDEPLLAEREEPVADEPPLVGRVPLAQQELQTLYEIARAADYGLDLHEYLTLAAHKLATLVPYRSFVAYFVDPDGKYLRAGLALGTAADKLALTSIPIGEKLSGWAALQKRSLTGRNHLSPLERDGTRSDLEDWWHDDEMRSLGSTLVAPMVAGEEVVGVLTLYDRTERAYTAGHRRILVRVAGYVAQVAGRMPSPIALREESLTDPLTGVPNARFLWLEAAQRMHQSRAASCGFGLLAFRVNGLEATSEQIGNETADRFLCQIARRFAAGCEANETLVRLGVDLFLVLTGTDGPGELVERLEDLTTRVEQTPLVGDHGLQQPVAVTAAHACFPRDGDDLDEILEVLDTRLALAARPGRTVVPFRPLRAQRGANR